MARRARDFDSEASESVLVKRHCGFPMQAQVHSKSIDDYVEGSSYEDMVRYWCAQENILFNNMIGKVQFP